MQDRQLQMLKAAIPYMGGNSQGTVAFLIKFMELKRTMELFQTPLSMVSICSVNETDEPKISQLLTSIRPYCTRNEQENIDIICNYMQMFSSYETLFT